MCTASFIVNQHLKIKIFLFNLKKKNMSVSQITFEWVLLGKDILNVYKC